MTNMEKIQYDVLEKVNTPDDLKKLSCDELKTLCEEIRAYIATKDPMDKAGAYGIQGDFAIHVKGIEGDYYNVVGLPIGKVYQQLKQLL